jgi:hypothetical protein
MIIYILALVGLAAVLFANCWLKAELAKARGWLQEIEDEELAKELLPDEQLRWPNMGQWP